MHTDAVFLIFNSYKLFECLNDRGWLRNVGTEPFNSAAQSSLDANFRFPSQRPLGFGDIRAATFGIVDAIRLENDAGRGFTQLNNDFCIFKHGMLFCVAEIKYLTRCMWFEHSPHQAIDKITHITNTACDAPITIDRQRLIKQSLCNKVRYHTPIVNLTIRTICIKNTDDARIHSVLAIVLHCQCLAQTLALVITGAWPDRIDVSPVIFTLWVDQWISICL